MSKALYDIYQQSVFDLVKTMVIKSTAVAEVFNKTLTNNLWPAPGNNQHTWRYYMNLAGEYHEYDEKYLANESIPGRMTIKVASVTGPVDAAFTRELLEGDAVIANEYRYGSPYYNALVTKYPLCVDLIHGILNPVEKDVAINAAEGEILYAGGYFKTVQDGRKLFIPRILPGRKPPNYIEENEDNLLPQLESYIQTVASRWNNPDYGDTNDLYVTSQLAILYMSLPAKILNIRLNNCFTPQVHSYHIREYLESNGKLIRFVDSIPKPQLHWLYRNLRWLEKNVGKTETFQLLIDKLITPLNMPLLGYDLKHNLANQDSVLPAEDYPESVMYRFPLSEGGIQLGDANRTISRIMTAQLDMARDNKWNIDDKGEELVQRMTMRSKSSRLPTKVLESSITDDSQSIVHPIARTLFDMWAYQASRDEYVASVYVTHPVTGERSLLSPKQCLIIYIYLITRDREEPPTEIPAVFAFNVPKSAFSSDPLVPARPTLVQFKNNAGKLLPANVVDSLYGANVALINPLTVEAFYAQAMEVHTELMRRYRVYSAVEDYTQRGLADSLAETLYFRAECRPVPDGTLFSTWMEENGVDISSLTQEQREKMALDILNAVTGVDEETANLRLRKVQEAIINAMRYLSSYAVQYLTEITGGRSFPGGWGPLRLGDISIRAEDNWRIERSKTTIVSSGLISSATGILIDDSSVPPELNIVDNVIARSESRLHYTVGNGGRANVRLPTSRFTILDVNNEDVPLILAAPDNVLDGFKYPE